MRYEIRHGETARTDYYDMLVCYEYDGLIKSIAYVPYTPAHVVIESVNDKLAMAFVVDSNGGIQALTLVHVSEITKKYGVFHRLLETVQKECETCGDNFELACELIDMELFIRGIIG